MAFHDLRGNPSGSGTAAARDSVEIALWRMMSFYDTPLADLDAAIAADPGWALPHTMKAGFLLSLTEPALHADAAEHLAQAATRIAGAPDAEQAHFEAVHALLEGRWHDACRLWDGLLIAVPRNALALQWAQLWDFHRGDANGLRQRPARALPEWDSADPLWPHVMALYAFGLEETNLFPQAEDAGRQALAADARVPWAVHAVAHVMEMQGRFDEGSAWLRQHQPQWAEGNGFAGHLWWHQGLFRLEALDVAGVLRLVDKHLSGDALQPACHRFDAASMLWRLHLIGEDVSALAAALVADWPADDASAGRHAFNDLHYLLALLAAGQGTRAESWIARCAERALAADGVRRANHAVAREVGLPLMRAMLAFARGDAAGAADGLYAARPAAQRIGGSHAQRELIDQTLLAACAAGARRALGRALLNERLMARPASPLARHWSERLGEAREVRA